MELAENKEEVAMSSNTCFERNWILTCNSLQQIKDEYVCVVCQQVASNPHQLVCKEHEEFGDSLIVGESCLKRYLQESNGQCPILQHTGCEYSHSELVQKQIDDLTVRCPRQYQLDSQAVQEKGKIFPKKDEPMTRCSFKGRLQDVNDHLENSCPLELSSCWFKPFGCAMILLKDSEQAHLLSQVQFHLDLVKTHVQTLEKKNQQFKVVILT
ncbi:hypothetical protein RFI_32415 [Reticulomyxa filosa]|uniref:TRAF-type domain-containing protein n=1 Tax=Reticulomyxa filosa TaxID=46433 RepID=X6LV20_RETFI|nr:hypothetical protein RFI_32415 [Reticulomyxa filosa]|eukprot:ETO04982.1 hypothetical protein RFI_32415 [Reticulomyxa filosa]